MASSISSTRMMLEKKLNHAFRYGSSAFRLGLMPQSISDHLPIVASLPEINASLLSWNLLADEHLFNNFMNINCAAQIEAALSRTLGGAENNIYAGAMYHLFAELAQFLFTATNETGQLKITPQLLKKFIDTNVQPSRKARSRDPQLALKKEQQVEQARETLVGLLTNPDDELAHEYRLALRQCMELIFHIKHQDGALRWPNRLKRLRNNAQLVAELVKQDIIALQECTNPNDIEQLFIDKDKSMQFITHNVRNDANSTDNVVLAFDSIKYRLVGEPIKTNFKGSKPAIYLKLQDITRGVTFIMGSIHHPGGEHDLRKEIMGHIKSLSGGEPLLPFFVAGDYNHTASQFTEKAHVAPLYYPKHGTMAGSDYGSTNQAIDAVMSNHDLSDSVTLCPALRLSPPAAMPFTIQMDLYELPMPAIFGKLEPLIPDLIAAKDCGLANAHEDDDLDTRTSIQLSA